MTTLKKSCWYFAGFFVLICIWLLIFSDKKTGNLSKKDKIIFAEKLEKITAEIGSLNDNSWAGEYFYGNGRSANVTLTLAPKSGFTYTWRGCMGICDQNFGEVTSDNEKLTLHCVLENESSIPCPEELIPIRWNDRHYLIQVDKIDEFCDAINAGFEPRDEKLGRFFLKTGDENKKTTGFPELPEKYTPLLHDNIEDKTASAENFERAAIEVELVGQ
ncbi:MAG: hypothetical protein ACRC2T_19705 [Thermoguttaceae bacterium]